ncbi:hypothetical protein GA0061098_103637 [Bradyrhizobium shewense]|uniref:Uncharacterized protein n=1 Tax=Bradyrhizobium shewense TaxID=1761772 RepID=A0A1C3XSM0_9BRAD|nr:hypothetical protein GA0061098_103637 [Bradyrhizobium shewense]
MVGSLESFAIQVGGTPYRDVPLHESGRGGLIISAFRKLLCLFIIKHAPKLTWRELLQIQSKVFWINRRWSGKVIILSSESSSCKSFASCWSSSEGTETGTC